MIEDSLPVPEAAKTLARGLWQRRTSAPDAAFGEAAKARVDEIRGLLSEAWFGTRRLFWMPGNFEDWPQEWRGFALRLHGLTYELARQATDSVLPDFSLPSPRVYRTDRFADLAAQDVCRRFAATVNRRGIIRFSRGDAAGALADFDAALAYYPEYSGAVENKGLVFFEAGQADSARSYLGRFVEMEPASPELPKVRAILSRLGQ